MILRVSLTLLSLHKEELLACQDFAQLVTAMKVCKGNITALLAGGGGGTAIYGPYRYVPL